MSDCRPGLLFLQLLKSANKQLASRGAGGDTGRQGSQLPSIQVYLNSIYLPAAGHSAVGPRNLSELKVLAMALDYLSSGQLSGLGDILAQRFKAIQTAVSDSGSWSVAQSLDLAPSSTVSLVDLQETATAARQELLKAKLLEARERIERKSGGQSSSRTSEKTGGAVGRGVNLGPGR